jgi:hypothetical protein
MGRTVADPRSRRTPLVVVGIMLLVAGLAGFGVLWYAARHRLDDAIAGLARAPVGCDTVLDFDEGGKYILFIETAGRIDDVRGDCEFDSDFTWGGDDGDTPAAVLTLTNQDGDEIALSRTSGTSYHAGGAVGTAVRKVTIADGGDHILRVDSSDTDFAVAVGRDPNDGVGALRLGALLALLAGLLFGLLLVGLGSRKRTSPVTVERRWDQHNTGVAGWPASPPGFPAPPPTTGTSAAVGPASPPIARMPTAPLPMPPRMPPSTAPSTAPGAAPHRADEPTQLPTPTRWGPPPPPSPGR